MSSQFKKCQTCNKFLVPQNQLKLVKQQDIPKVCFCGKMEIPKPTPAPVKKPAPVIQKPVPAKPKVVLKRCKVCNKSILPADLMVEFNLKEIGAALCECPEIVEEPPTAIEVKPERPQQFVVQNPAPQQQVVYVVNDKKEKWVPDQFVAILLLLFFGFFGVHRFYVGDKTLGLLMLMSSLFFIPIISVITMGIGLVFYIVMAAHLLLELIVWLMRSRKEWANRYAQ